MIVEEPRRNPSRLLEVTRNEQESSAPNPLILGTDFRLASECALEAAAALASHVNPVVRVLHVAESIGHATSEEHYRRSLGNELLAGVTHRLGARNVKVASAEIKSGRLLETTLEVASQHAAQLLVIGAGEQTPSPQLVTVVNAEAVLAHAEISVLAVHPGDPALRFRRILCAADQSEASRLGSNRWTRGPPHAVLDVAGKESGR